MSVQTYPNGIGGLSPSGDPLGLARPLYTTGNVWYVSSLIGTNAAAPAGQNREKPLATIAQAYTNAAAGDIIVFLPGHVQAVSTNLNINKGDLTFVGEGTDASGKPAVQFSPSAFQTLFTVQTNGSGVEFRNIYFPQRTLLSTSTRIITIADDTLFSGCYFECGANDNERAIVISANRARVRRCTFVSTGTLTSAQPKSAIEVGAVPIVGLEITDCVVDAGTVGFSGGVASLSAIDLSAATSISRLRVEGLSLLHGADANFGAGTVTGRANVQLATGGSRVAWS